MGEETTVAIAYERKRIYGRKKSENLTQVAGFFFLVWFPVYDR